LCEAADIVESVSQRDRNKRLGAASYRGSSCWISVSDDRLGTCVGRAAQRPARCLSDLPTKVCQSGDAFDTQPINQADSETFRTFH
jgi:hypothetical protein